MSIEAGGAFRCKSEDLTGEMRHLWVILTDPVTYPDCVVIVNVTTTHTGKQVVRNYDPACDLKRGDHNLIIHPSFVFYNEAMVVTVQKLEDAEIGHTTSFDQAVLQRIRDGAGKSRFLDRGIKRRLLDQGILPQGAGA